MDGMEPEPLTPAGNAGLADDFYVREKQLIIGTTKSGNYFYIFIDRTNEDKEIAVHFLNQMDEARRHRSQRNPRPRRKRLRAKMRAG